MLFLDTDCNYISPENSAKKRKSDDEDTNNTSVKKAKIEDPEKTNVSKSKDIEMKETERNELKYLAGTEKDSAKEHVESVAEVKDTKKSSALKPVGEKDDIEENLQCMICQEIMHDCIRYN